MVSRSASSISGARHAAYPSTPANTTANDVDRPSSSAKHSSAMAEPPHTHARLSRLPRAPRASESSPTSGGPKKLMAGDNAAMKPIAEPEKPCESSQSGKYGEYRPSAANAAK